jgi:acetyltransferase-like isoleucine patch superfamily enzyme
MRTKDLIRQLLNNCFRGNNLFSARISALWNHNQIVISEKANLKDCRFCLSGKNNRITICDYCSLEGVVFYTNCDNNVIMIGNNVKVNAGKDCPTRFNACNGCSITIGDDCLFSNNIEVHTSDYHPIYHDKKKINQSKSVVIGAHSWIGLRAVVLKGVKLAPNTIVGACSVVTCTNNTPYTAIAGNPAHGIKNNVLWRYTEKESPEECILIKESERHD